MLRVAMVHGGAAADHDGVADYVEHLIDALPAVDVRAMPVELTSLTEVRDRLRCLAPAVVHVRFAPSGLSAPRAHRDHRSALLVDR
ncbi:MAG TPA: hypothetical protein VGJ45_17610 [Pseudonocardiaceae bacterium]|jgi:hypothetical protein